MRKVICNCHSVEVANGTKTFSFRISVHDCLWRLALVMGLCSCCLSSMLAGDSVSGHADWLKEKRGVVALDRSVLGILETWQGEGLPIHLDEDVERNSRRLDKKITAYFIDLEMRYVIAWLAETIDAVMVKEGSGLRLVSSTTVKPATALEVVHFTEETNGAWLASVQEKLNKGITDKREDRPSDTAIHTVRDFIDVLMEAREIPYVVQRDVDSALLERAVDFGDSYTGAFGGFLRKVLKQAGLAFTVRGGCVVIGPTAVPSEEGEGSPDKKLKGK